MTGPLGAEELDAWYLQPCNIGQMIRAAATPRGGFRHNSAGDEVLHFAPPRDDPIFNARLSAARGGSPHAASLADPRRPSARANTNEKTITEITFLN